MQSFRFSLFYFVPDKVRIPLEDVILLGNWYRSM